MLCGPAKAGPTPILLGPAGRGKCFVPVRWAGQSAWWRQVLPWMQSGEGSLSRIICVSLLTFSSVGSPLGRMRALFFAAMAQKYASRRSGFTSPPRDSSTARLYCALR